MGRRYNLSSLVPVMTIICCMVISLSISAQSDNILIKQYTPKQSEASALDQLTYLAEQTQISLSYSTSRFDPSRIIPLERRKYTVQEAMEVIFASYHYEIIPRPNDKLIIIVKEDLTPVTINISGRVSDADTGENLYGASIYHLGYQRGTHSNPDGFFSISDIKVDDLLSFSYVGYRDTVISITNTDQGILNLQLTPSEELNTVVITYIERELDNPDSGGEFLDINDPNARISIIGEKDVLHITRQSAGVSSGSEGQGGLLVRGGTPDQNLILLDQVPMYAVNHMADISSIFIDEAVRDVQLIKGGFPSRYSGRLSSVLSVNLKEGNKNRIGGSVTAGLPGVKTFLEGPLHDQTRFMLGSRISWINAYLNPLVDQFTNFDNIGLDYYDIVGKMTHRFNDANKFSLSTYIGGDDVDLSKKTNEENGEGQNFLTSEASNFGWNNVLFSGNYASALSNRWYMTANAGLLNYSYRSRGSFEFTTSEDDIIIETSEQDVITDSNITDYLGGIQLEYYISDAHRIKFGSSFTHHRFSPKVFQSNQILEEVDIAIDSDSITLGNEFSIFIEDIFRPAEHIEIFGGINHSTFSVRGSTYRYWQPRMHFSIRPQDHLKVSVSASRMVQYVHLLINNGLGLPSDLWVPSTDQIAPEISDQLSLAVNYELNDYLSLSVGGFIKKQKNIILYSNPEDLFAAVLNSSNSSEVNFINDRDWERSIDIGTRDVRGIEVSLKNKYGPWLSTVTYTKSNTENRFDDINDGNAFRDQFDRPHDVNISTSYQLNKFWSIGAQWVYGSGNTFTLALQEFNSQLGVTLLNSENRNNYRMPAYHHLDLQVTYDATEDVRGWKVNFGIYNVYNRLNPYYLILYNNKAREELVFKKISLFPILPYFNISYQF